MDPPQEVVRQLLVGRHAEAGDSSALGLKAVKTLRMVPSLPPPSMACSTMSRDCPFSAHNRS